MYLSPVMMKSSGMPPVLMIMEQEELHGHCTASKPQVRFKGIVHPKVNSCCKCTLPLAIQDGITLCFLYLLFYLSKCR